MRYVLGLKDREPVLPPDLAAAICATFDSSGELMGDFTAHQRIRLGVELTRLEAAPPKPPPTPPPSTAR